MNPRPIITSSVMVSVLFVAAVYVGGKWVFESGRVDDLTVDVVTPTAPVLIKETDNPTPPRTDTDKPKREYKSTEEILANASPEFRKKYAEMLEYAKAAGKQYTDPESAALIKEASALRKQIRAEIAEREAELAEEDDFDEWIKGVEKRREAYLREIEEAKRISETHRNNLERFKRKLQQLGLWDYKADKPKTTQ